MLLRIWQASVADMVDRRDVPAADTHHGPGLELVGIVVACFSLQEAFAMTTLKPSDTCHRVCRVCATGSRG